MWMRFTERLRCPGCHAQLLLSPFEVTEASLSRELLELAERRKMLDERFSRYIESGLLL